MAQSSRGDITQKIELVGSEEVLRRLQQLGSTGEKAFAGLNRGAVSVGRPLTDMHRNTRNVGFAMQNLSFQVNDVASQLASGAPLMQIFAQQAGQFVQVFQQGGGVSAVLSGVSSSIRSMITPMRV